MFYRRPANPYSSLVGGVVFLGFALWTTCTTIVNYTSQQAAATQYQRVSARVVQSKVKETVRHTRNGTRRNYSPDLQFRYEVAGAPYISDRYCFMGGECCNRQAAQQIVNRYGVGRHVTAWYNPHDPSVAVLNNDPPTLSSSQSFVLVIFWLGGLGLVGWSLYRILPRRAPAPTAPLAAPKDLANARFYDPAM